MKANWGNLNRAFWLEFGSLAGRLLLLSSISFAAVLAILRWSPLFVTYWFGLPCIALMMALPLVWHSIELVRRAKKAYRQKAAVRKIGGGI